MKNSFTFEAHKPMEKYHKCDVAFLVSVLLLWGLGMFTLFVCSQTYAVRFFNNDSFYFVKRQCICSFAGLILFFIFLLLDMEIIKKMILYIVIGSIVLCIMTFIPFFSIMKNGAYRWVRMPFNFSFQPSELVKFALVLYLAAYFDKQMEIEDEKQRDVLPCVAIFMMFLALIILQKDFSTTVFVAAIGVSMFFVSGAKLKWIFPFMLLAIPLVIILITSEQYRMERIIGFLNPEQGASSFNYQVNASKNAITAGGFWGAGIGRGLSKLDSIPEVQADYIFAGWTESMGFLGVIIYFLLLCFFAWRGYKTAFECPSRFASYGSFGCVTIILFQSIVNCMVVCGILPSTGLPLPFFTAGGSSIIVTLAMCGFILNASRCEEKSEVNYVYEDVNLDTLTIL